MNRPRPRAVRRSVVVATWAAVAVASVAAARAVVDRACRPPTRCPSELVAAPSGSAPAAHPRALARSVR